MDDCLGGGRLPSHRWVLLELGARRFGTISAALSLSGGVGPRGHGSVGES